MDDALRKRRQLSNAMMAERHRGFDLAAKDRTAKFERPSFAVTGEGTREARERYLKNYSLIDWGK